MQNAIIAQMFDEIGDCLELAGDNVFKIRAYRRAAEAVANYQEPIEQAAENNTLRQIEGLGEATAGKIREFLATGQMRMLEELRAEYPAGMIELLKVPNLGPKKVALLYRERGISSIENLMEAIDKGELKGISGFGPKTIQNIKQGIERLAQMTNRLPLNEATRVANDVRGALQRKTNVRVEIAGSLRRGCDTMGDINLLAESESPAEVVAAFTSLPSALAVEESDETSATICARPGIRVRLRCAPAESFGAALLHNTGSTAHWDAAQQRATEVGLELRDDGLFKGSRRLPTKEEEQIFKALGAGFIAPELRENKGEWQAAIENRLPELLRIEDIQGDLHSHSTWSDGVVSIRQMAQAMQDRGYRYFAVTDHSKALAMANGLDAKRLREQAKEIAEVQAEFPNLKILRGVECDIMRDGSLDLDDDILHELDIVVASVHSGFSLDEATQTERMVRAISHPAVDILAHPTGRVLGVRPPYAVNVNALIEAARDSATTIEINASERLDLSDVNAYAAREAGVLLSIDSDAHSTRMLPNVAYGVTTARRAWCEKKDILNAKSTEDLLRWLKR